MNRLPPLNPLHVFAVVARCRNLSRAAAELGVTQSAVSRQITALEKHFDQKLFLRSRYGLDLLPHAQAFHQQVTQAFALIEKSTEAFESALAQVEQTIRIKCYTTFAARWLIPHLADFCAQYPHIKIVIKTGAKLVDFAKNEADLAVQILKRPAEHMEAVVLFEDVIEPVCSPAFLKLHAPDTRYPSALLRQTVIATKYRTFDWLTWISQSGYEHDYAPLKLMEIENAVLAWKAAAGGVGIAMGQTRLLADKIASGELITPFNHPVFTDRKYYVALPRQHAKPGAFLFRNWLLQQFGQAAPGTAA